MYRSKWCEKYSIWKASPAMLSKNLPSSLLRIGVGPSHVLKPLSHAGATMRQLDTPRRGVHILRFWSTAILVFGGRCATISLIIVTRGHYHIILDARFRNPPIGGFKHVECLCGTPWIVSLLKTWFFQLCMIASTLFWPNSIDTFNGLIVLRIHF